MYRSRFLGQEGSNWIFSAPIQRDALVPLSVGESLVCEAAAAGGLMVFEARVVARDRVSGEITVARPRVATLRNRRTESRRIDTGLQARVNDRACELIDLSAGGLRAQLSDFVREGDRVTVTLSDGQRRKGDVIDSSPNPSGSLVRVVFDEPVRLAS